MVRDTLGATLVEIRITSKTALFEMILRANNPVCMIFENKAKNTIRLSLHQCIFKLHNSDISSLQQGSYYSQYYIINFLVQQSELEIVNHDQK